jgi:outer membrane protein assembly factor BamB
MKRTVLIVAAACLAVASSAADWPQWRGPDRTEISRETGLLKDWPAGGPKLLWTFSDAGIGYSGPAIVGDRLYSLGADEKDEFVFALDTRTGKQVWKATYGPRYRNGYGDGPRCTPTVDGDRLFILGGQGELVCLEAENGDKVWSVNLIKDLGGRMMSGWGYSESPLVDGAQVVVSPGGPGGTLAALDKNTGKVIWRSEGLTDRATYSSIIAAEVGGTRQYIQTAYSGDGIIAGVAAKDGKLLWKVDRPGYRTAVVPTPVYHDNHVYVTAGYGAGCDLIKLTPQGQGGFQAEKVYDNNKNMKNHHGGVVLLDGHLFGYSDGNGWVCQDFYTGKNVWEDRRQLPKGSLTYADGRLYLYSERDGTCVMIEPSTEGWKEHGRFTIPATPNKSRVNYASNVWTHPVVANGRLYLRDQGLLHCYDVRGDGGAAE